MKQILIFLFLLYCLTPRVYSQNAPLKLGAERMDVVTRLLKGKRVGLVVNQTSILEKRQIHLLDALVAEGVDVKKVFAPEHGFRGTGDARGDIRQPGLENRHPHHLYLWEKQETVRRATGRPRRDCFRYTRCRCPFLYLYQYDALRDGSLRRKQQRVYRVGPPEPE